MSSHDLHPDTQAVHLGREDLGALGVHALPIDLSTTNPLPNIDLGGDSYEALATGHRPIDGGSFVYERLWNPTVARFEKAFAATEHAEAAVAFASGMAATTAMILACTGRPSSSDEPVATHKRHIVAVRPLYGGTDHLLGSGMLGTEVTFCEEDDVAASIRPDTALVILESPTNPTLQLADIAGVVEQSAGVPVAVDNTFATPVLQNPLDLGAAMSLHSATKYIGGHGDVLAGVIACDEETAVKLRSVRAITGAVLHPLAGYLLHRGLATLPLRLRQQQRNAQRIAHWLHTQPEVAEVFYPGLDGDSRGLLARQMRGTGAMVSIRLAGGYAAASALTSAVELFTHAVSLGGVDSLIQHPAALTHRPVPPDARPSADVVRMSIGIEFVDDLIADLRQALDAIVG